MPTKYRSLSALNRAMSSADPLPMGNGREMVRYMGGTRRATQILSGLDHSPKPSEYRSQDKWRADWLRWRDASRQAQRWAKGERGRTKTPMTEAQKRRAQAANRETKRVANRGKHLVARVTALISVESGGDPRAYSRTRSLPKSAGEGFAIPNGSQVLDLYRRGQTTQARDALDVGMIEAAGMPDETMIEKPQWELWLE